MSIANYFYHGTTKKYISLFGSIFNKLSLQRFDKNGNFVQKFTVPISYGPYQKFLSRLTQDPNLDNKTAIVLPRMAFEITSIRYDGERKVPILNKIKSSTSSTKNLNNFHTPTPYNFDFNLYIMTKYAEDGTQLLEQFLPFFKPEWPTTVKIIDEIDPFDVPIVYTGMSIEDIYENNYEERRSMVWTLSFTMKAWLFGPIRDTKVIKFIDVRLNNSTDFDNSILERLTIQPGLTANGESTDNISNTVPYEEISFDDDWGTIIMVDEEYKEEN